MRSIACFYQNDSYGFAGLNGIRLALEKRGIELVAEGSYERNTVAVMGGLRDIHRGNPDAIVLVGAYSACAEFIKLSKVKTAKEIIYCNISFVGMESLRKALGRYGKNVIVSQVVPYPRDAELVLVKEYLEDMNKYQHDAPVSFTSLEGYISGQLFGAIARAVPGELTREKFITTMEKTGVFDLGGVVLRYGPQDHQGMDDIHLTKIYPVIQKIVHDE